MTSLKHWLLAALAASAVCAEQVQKSDLQLPDSAAIYKEATKDLFVTSYEAYQYVRCIAWVSSCTNLLRTENMHGGMMI